MSTVNYLYERMFVMSDKKKRDKVRSTLSSMQEVTYQHEFKLADRAGGFTKRGSSKH